MMNNYYRSVASEEMSDFESYYRSVAATLPPNAFIAELGVADGRSVILMASLMNYLQKPCTIWAVDDFSYGKDLQRETLLRNIKNSGETTIEVMELDTLAAACRSQDDQFNFVFIDSSHLYENTRAEIMLWYHKVMPTGILAGHDYSDNREVQKAVDEMVPIRDLNIVETGHGHGVWWVAKNPMLKLLK